MKLLARVLVFLLIPFLFASVAFAKTSDRKQTTMTLPRAEVVNHDYFASADVVTVSGTVNGDAYVAGGTVLIDGVVNGDVLAAGGMVTIRGPVKGNVRAAGGLVTVASRVGGNATLGAGTLAITDTAVITGSIVAGAGNMEISGPVGRGATIGAGNLVIASRIGGDVTAGTGKLSLTDKALIGGNLTYWSKEEETFSKTMVVGTVTRHATPQPKTNVAVSPRSAKLAVATVLGVVAIGVVLYIVAKFILGLILFHAFPVFTTKTLSRIGNNPWQSFGIGLVTMIVLPIAGGIALVSVIGIPLGIMIFFAMAIYMFVSYLYAALFAGERVLAWFKKSPARAWQFLTGLVLLGIVGAIPVLGLLVKTVLTLAATGALVAQKIAVYKLMRSHHTV